MAQNGQQQRQRHSHRHYRRGHQYDHRRYPLSQFKDRHPVALLSGSNTVAGIGKIRPSAEKIATQGEFTLLPFSSNYCSPCTSLTLYPPLTFQFVSAQAPAPDFAATARPWPKAAMGTASIATVKGQGEFSPAAFVVKKIRLCTPNPPSLLLLPLNCLGQRGLARLCGHCPSHGLQLPWGHPNCICQKAR